MTVKARVLVYRSCGHNHIARTNPENSYYKVGEGYYCPDCNANTTVTAVEVAGAAS